MLATHHIIGFVPTKDFPRAKAFYQNVLGLEFSGEDSFAVEFLAGGNRVRLTKVDSFEPRPFAILGWEVPDIIRVVAGLQERGLVFEKYSFLKQDPLGIWDSPSGARVAWFKDPDSNVLSISQHPAD